MRVLNQLLIAGIVCLALCHAMPNPDPEPQPDVNVGVNVDVMKPKKDDGSDINVDVNVNIDEDGSNSADSGEDVDVVGCTCGKPNKMEKIIGGWDVDFPVKYPWHVGLYSRKEFGLSYFCGATIINNLFILSAAHCSRGWSSPDGPSDLLIGIGDHDQNSTLDDFDGITIKASVKQVHVHPGYDDDTEDLDFSLIELSTPLEFGDILRPICLPEDDLNTYEGDTGTIVGWGLTDYYDYDFPDILQETHVTIMDPTCDDYHLNITDNMLCASYPERDACYGDSGGSISVVENGVFVQVGVTSWGIGCASEDHPGIYSRVTSVLKWIHQVCSEAEWCPRG